MLPPRVVLNRVYRLLVADLDVEGREKLDGDLWAPAEGWDAAEAAMLRRLDAVATEGGG